MASVKLARLSEALALLQQVPQTSQVSVLFDIRCDFALLSLRWRGAQVPDLL